MCEGGEYTPCPERVDLASSFRNMRFPKGGRGGGSHVCSVCVCAEVKEREQNLRRGRVK